jgi:hypothetical protein
MDKDQVAFEPTSPVSLYSKNLRPAPFVDEDGAYEREQVPYEYHIGTMLMRELERKP